MDSHDSEHLWRQFLAHKEDLSPSFRLEIPSGDDRERSVCTRCSFIDYRNPRIVVGSVATDDSGRILLCQRAIEPRKSWWTLPAGYLETNESAEAGARREAREEAGAKLEIDRLLAVYSLPRISQVQLMYRARLTNPDTIAAGPESEDLMLVSFEDIPWPDLAFPSVSWALRDWRAVEGQADFAVRSNPADGL
ncbi:NUDIX hydrolase [Parvularcula marina]|uniref:NUDIX domain-containing protein n=1 Tax=Parvularcula marina TaxID=2292771 RepID=A0A371RIT0_9PROT|nr:NUDIX hydrolase [Parvularcula marina]RFB05352.1 NUDIX domain-containing protein [Parvularcula marina]